MENLKKNLGSNLHLFTRDELRKIRGGSDYGYAGCYGTYDDKYCSFDGPGGTKVSGECGTADNGYQCRCIAFDRSSSVPQDYCKK